MGTEGKVRKSLEPRVGYRLEDPRTVVNGEGPRDQPVGSCCSICPRSLEMVLKRVYTFLSSWNQLEDFDRIFWGQKSTLAG